MHADIGECSNRKFRSLDCAVIVRCRSLGLTHYLLEFVEEIGLVLSQDLNVGGQFIVDLPTNSGNSLDSRSRSVCRAR